jgi:organic radical activating enzyme
MRSRIFRRWSHYPVAIQRCSHWRRSLALGRHTGHAFALETQGSMAQSWFAQLDWLILSPKPTVPHAEAQASAGLSTSLAPRGYHARAARPQWRAQSGALAVISHGSNNAPEYRHSGDPHLFNEQRSEQKNQSRDPRQLGAN